ncbi:glycosyltransferase [Arthrobacter sp. zg-Y1110]|uniref:glycosyltransferase n=1 Tax=Arthrobacter sp. zg-Y1110 TaxID=2886932 RepID=UPI001D133882|nr:glycosyltransferase [Arthrobacter sp. zg-Y1110]MCC3292037.1 glycosyltransferase [Arthrobacter sp. zg-Y1110]UWX85846.1 glycosyltransferase [Arthrobacter sp. zg-Y1110]
MKARGQGAAGGLLTSVPKTADGPAASPAIQEHRRRDRSGPVPAVLQIGGLAGAAAGGVWVVAQMQSDALAGLGVKVDLVGGWLGVPPATHAGAAAPQAPSIPADRGRPAVVPRLFRMRRPAPGAGLRAPVSLALPRYVRRAAAGADVAHVHLCRDFVTCASAFLLVRAKVPVVAQAHGMLQPSRRPLLRAFDLLITRRILRIPTLWLTLTEDEERGLTELGVDPARFHRVVNASAEPRQRWSDPDTAVFLFAARLAPRKQPGVFVQAAIQALDAGLDARFVVVGPDQGEAAKVRALIAASRHADRFEFVGELPAAGVQARMAACTAYVLPALSEPYPMTVLEAAALGTPLILTVQCGLAPLMARQDAAVVVEPDVSTVRDAMLELARNPAARVRIGGNARRVHRDNWSTRALAEDLLTTYRGVAASEGRQP